MLGIKPQDRPDREGARWIGPAPWIQTALPGPDAAVVIDRDRRVSSHSYSEALPLVVRRGHGSVLEDVDGNRFLDFGAGTAVCATGHCHPRVAAAAEAQLHSLIHIPGHDFHYPIATEVMERLVSITPGTEPKRVLLTNSGAEAVEAAIKLAWHHTGRKGIIAFRGADHGRTMGALTVTCSKVEQWEGAPLQSVVEHVPFGDVEALETHVLRGKLPTKDVAAIFVEAIQGEGGYNVPAPEFLPRLRSLCDEHGILLICDEIQSGVGRTGKWFAFEHFGVVPDVVLLAKGIASGMPLGAVVSKAAVTDWPNGPQRSTFAGSPVSCAAALATLDLVESGYMANAARLGVILKDALTDIAGKTKVLSNVRGLGLMCGVDTINRKTGKADVRLRRRLLYSCFERGLLLLPCGESGIRFCPPMCINEAQLDVGLKVFTEGVATVT